MNILIKKIKEIVDVKDKKYKRIALKNERFE